MDFLKNGILALQDFYLLAWQALRNIFRRPFYWNDLFMQMDAIGVGSVPIVLLTGFFSGAIMALQSYRALVIYGATDQVGSLVAIVLVRELGPVLTALLVAGRNASGIASELGSMKVSEQIDAMRALGTDPVQKLVTPRMLATAIMLPLLTILADFVGLIGGYLVSISIMNITATQYWTTAYQSIEWNDIGQGLLKPFVFAFIVALVGCFYGLRTTGGTQGVGRSTTEAVVISSVWIFVTTFFIGKIFVSVH